MVKEIKTNDVEKILQEAELVDKPKWYQKLDDWLFDHSNVYAYIWRFYNNHLSPSQIKRMVKFFFQRRIRGFDDSETWALDWTFYNWIYPRLKRFAKVMQAYPTNTTYEDWKAELEKRVKQLDDLIHICEFDFTDWSYISDEEMKFLRQKEKEDGGDWTSTINATAYERCEDDFNKWFCENVNQLWW